MLTHQARQVYCADMAERRKPARERKETFVRVRLTLAQKEAFEAAARKAGLDLSNWLRLIATRECQK